MLTVLQTVLGLDNLLYIAIESKKANQKDQKMVRRMGIGIAILLRVVLLFLIIKMIGYFQENLFTVNSEILKGEFNLHSLIVLIGGVFIMYTATNEIIHMLNFNEKNIDDRKQKNTPKIILSIIFMNLIFSFDSILAALAITDIFFLMVLAIIISGAIMILLADKVAEFLKKNRMFEVLGLFILFIVGIMLLCEGGHLAKIYIFNNPITQMSKTTFYFVIFSLISIDLIQNKYQKKFK
jgi:predicted tellurium resistance membrane protein TerC